MRPTLGRSAGCPGRNPLGPAAKLPDGRETIAFLGPSLPREEGRRLLPADYRPPIRRGDLEHIGADRTVAVIDGRLDPESAIPAAEIRRALERGVRVYGAASVGALRAAELADAGMIGVGWVYEAYRSGRITSSDEIAVLYHPRTLRPLTVPIVSVRHRLERLVAQGEITPDSAERALAAVLQLELPDRDTATIGRCLAQHLRPAQAARSFIDDGRFLPDVKADDARRLLRLLGKRPTECRGSAREQGDG